MKALARRDDLYWEDIIEALLKRSPQDYRIEIFLELLLDILLSGPADRLEKWVTVNPNGCNLLVRNLGHFYSHSLKSRVIRLMPYVERENLKSFLMTECDYLAKELAAGDGILPDGRLRELIALFDVMQNLNDPDFLEMSITLTELSLQKIAVIRGRDVARSLTVPQD